LSRERITASDYICSHYRSSGSFDLLPQSAVFAALAMSVAMGNARNGRAGGVLTRLHSYIGHIVAG
jgi:hypothetical protein